MSLIADVADVETEYELSSSEDEYETLILGQTEQEAMDSLREDLQKEAYKHFLLVRDGRGAQPRLPEGVGRGIRCRNDAAAAPPEVRGRARAA